MSDAHILLTALESRLSQETGRPVQARDLRPLAGGASQEIWQFDLMVADDHWQGARPLVLRWQQGGKIQASALDLAGEYTVLQAAYAAAAPVPRPYWYWPELLGRQALLMERVNGETIGRRIVTRPELAAARTQLPHQLGTALAAIHAIPYRNTPLQTLLPGPAAGQTPAQFRLAQLTAELDRLGEPHPALELGLRWLRRREPEPPAHLVVLHGDFRIGNVVVNQAGLVSVLDWEFSHLGDPAEDLAWPLLRAWRFGLDHLRFGGLSEPEPFWQAYEAAGGRPVDPTRVFYWEVMGNVAWAVGALNQAHRHLSGQQPSLELASLGRKCAEMELELLTLIQPPYARPPDRQ
ncbi:MAG: phosphotransferase family protein [Chloroflexota bacterium]